jgi:hypothetical protein
MILKRFFVNLCPSQSVYGIHIQQSSLARPCVLIFHFPDSLMWPRWREVAAQILGPVPEAVVTVSGTPDDGCNLHPKHVE